MISMENCELKALLQKILSEGLQYGFMYSYSVLDDELERREIVDQASIKAAFADRLTEMVEQIQSIAGVDVEEDTPEYTEEDDDSESWKTGWPGSFGG